MSFRERLRVPLWWWPIGLVLGLALAAEAPVDGYGPVAAAGPYVLVALAVAGLLLFLGRIRIRVEDGELHVDDAHIPLTLLGPAEPLDADAKRRELGPDLDRWAFVVLRPWVRGAVLVLVADPADPTPYWIVSCRHPDRLVVALAAARGEHSPAR